MRTAEHEGVLLLGTRRAPLVFGGVEFRAYRLGNGHHALIANVEGLGLVRRNHRRSTYMASLNGRLLGDRFKSERAAVAALVAAIRHAHIHKGETQMTASNARIYRRRNGQWGSSCDGVSDTGHTIIEVAGRFTVYSVQDMQEDRAICIKGTREDAERAIAVDWRMAS